MTSITMINPLTHILTRLRGDIGKTRWIVIFDYSLSIFLVLFLVLLLFPVLFPVLPELSSPDARLPGSSARL
jgi:hypothetical protein